MTDKEVAMLGARLFRIVADRMIADPNTSSHSQTACLRVIEERVESGR